MTRDDAKKAIANYCGATIDKLCQDKNYCNLEGFIFSLSLIGSEGSAKKKSGFYYYSTASLRKEKEVMGLWLQDKLRNNGFSKEEFQVRKKNRKIEEGKEGDEGHVADFYLDIDWEELSDKDLTQIKKLYERLKTFQKNDKAWPNDEDERKSLIKLYNEKHLLDIRKYIEQRFKGLKESVSKEEQPSKPNQDSNIQPIMTPIQSLLLANLNVILTGAPGTGKTYTAKEVAKMMVGATVSDTATEEEKKKAKKVEEKCIASVQFHPGYDYSDFVIGMKPVLLSEKGKELEKKNGKYVLAGTEEEISDIGDAKVSFRWKDGIFKEFADKARKEYDKAEDKANAPKFVFLIDEINRADLSRVFGELFSLLEEEYRYPNGEGTDFILLPNGDRFSIPKNLYVIGTMNDIDRSVESMDFALRRRFAWYEVKADNSKPIIGKKVASAEAVKKLEGAMDRLNGFISGTKDVAVENATVNLGSFLGSAYELGGAIFAKYEKYQNDAEAFQKLWDNHIKNILSEYLRGRSNRDPLLNTLEDEYKKAVKIKSESPKDSISD